MSVQRPAGANHSVTPSQSLLRTVRLSRTEGQSLGFDVTVKKQQDFWSKGSLVTVSSVAEDGLGGQAGIKVDDRILEINGLKMSSTTPKTVIELLRRPELTVQVKAPSLPRGPAQSASGGQAAETGDCTIC